MTDKQPAEWNSGFLWQLFGKVADYCAEPRLPNEPADDYIARMYREGRIDNHVFLSIQQQLLNYY